MSSQSLKVLPMRLTPINSAEAIIEPFWNPELSGLSAWTIEPGPVHGLKVSQNWCRVEFEWARRPKAGPALCMTRRNCGVACAGYDTLLVSVMAPEGSVVRITLGTDRGEIVHSASPAPKIKQEVAVDLDGATRLDTITLEIEACADEPAVGWFNWVGLQKSHILPHHLAQLERTATAWTPYLRDEGYAPAFIPSYGIVVTHAELERLRAVHRGFVVRGEASPYTKAAERYWDTEPEALITESLNYDTRYNRVREHGRSVLGVTRELLLAAVIIEDTLLLRLGARYALALASVPVWDWGAISRFPGSSFDVRVFTNAGAAEDLAFALDVGGEIFTQAGRNLLMRRIAEDGIGAINYNAWKYEYIHHCNQLPAFSAGRILGYAVLERVWPRVRPYHDLAFRDLVDSLSDTVLPDGGYVEGPGYLTYAVGQGGQGLFTHARARGLTLAQCVPERFQTLRAFAAALISIDDSADVIPICDSRPCVDRRATALLAASLPDSQWVTVHRKALQREGASGELMVQQLDEAIPAAGPDPDHFVSLPEMGVMASTRRHGEYWVKLFIMGNKAGAGHTHEDKGSFVLEYAGETFAMDPGTCDYSNPMAELLKNCERHNMLVPIETTERPYPACPIPVDVKPHGEGDAIAFQAEIDLSPGWEAYYRTWVRSWESPKPEYLIIRDRWALRRGTGAACYWQTRQSVQLDGHIVTITGRRGQVVVTAPENYDISVEELPLMNDEAQRRITFAYNAIEGEAILRVNLIPFST